MQGGVWWSEASPGAGWRERGWERVPQRVPGLPLLLPQDDPLQDSLEGQEQREVLQAGWHWQEGQGPSLSCQVLHLKTERSREDILKKSKVIDIKKSFLSSIYVSLLRMFRPHKLTML